MQTDGIAAFDNRALVEKSPRALFLVESVQAFRDELVGFQKRHQALLVVTAKGFEQDSIEVHVVHIVFVILEEPLGEPFPDRGICDQRSESRKGLHGVDCIS